jgi:hypothetical protein
MGTKQILDGGCRQGGWKLSESLLQSIECHRAVVGTQWLRKCTIVIM